MIEKNTAKEKLYVQDRSIVVPGELLAEGMGFIPSKGIYRDGELIRAERLGMISVDKNVIKLIPLSGRYIPKVNDRVIGKVIDVLLSGWKLDINSAYNAVLTLKDASSEFIAKGENLTKYYDLEDFVVTKITKVTSQKLVDITMIGPGLMTLRGGRIITVNPFKVPRIIGKEGSMVTLIKQKTGCNIVVGQNGWVWINGEPECEVKAVQAIRMVEKQAHLQGLTEIIKVFLEAK
ncbi:RNA-binding protein [Candidatus Woesearchaeota archaeon]|nr:RNA-binding protein [Candidatus Woesearchaeota archaeon]